MQGGQDVDGFIIGCTVAGIILLVKVFVITKILGVKWSNNRVSLSILIAHIFSGISGVVLTLFGINSRWFLCWIVWVNPQFGVTNYVGEYLYTTLIVAGVSFVVEAIILSLVLRTQSFQKTLLSVLVANILIAILGMIYILTMSSIY